MTKKDHLLLGAHMSIAGGMEKAIERGESIGCTAIQIFTKSSRQWKAAPLTDQEVELFKETWQKSSIREIIAHASYLLNIASGDSKIRHQSKAGLLEELLRCHQLGVKKLVLHPGAYRDFPRQEAIATLARMIDEIMDETEFTGQLLLEIMAGQGTTLGRSFEELGEIYDKIHHKKRVALCFDTCHVFVAGYDFRTSQAYEELWQEFEKVFDISMIQAFHFNDSKRELAAHVDRHARIGEGELGLKPFSFIINDPRFFAIPKVLETPYHELTDFQEEMEAIIKTLTPENRKRLLG